MAVLSSQHLRDRLYHPNPVERLVITPLLDMSRQVAKAAVDVRLGSEFLILRQTRLAGLMVNVLGANQSLGRGEPEAGEGELELDRDQSRRRITEEVEETTEETYVPLGSAFILHPGQFVLTATLEYVSMPRSLMAYVVGRSSWGRLGLNIATATMVAPGFKGAM